MNNIYPAYVLNCEKLLNKLIEKYQYGEFTYPQASEILKQENLMNFTLSHCYRGGAIHKISRGVYRARPIMHDTLSKIHNSVKNNHRENNKKYRKGIIKNTNKRYIEIYNQVTNCMAAGHGKKEAIIHAAQFYGISIGVVYHALRANGLKGNNNDHRPFIVKDLRSHEFKMEHDSKYRSENSNTLNEKNSIDLLKKLGYKIMKPINKYEEI